MHEHSFIEAILSNIKDINNVKEVLIEVGDLAGVEKEHLKEHMLEKVSFSISVIGKKSDVLCDCGFRGEAKIRERLHDLVIYECPLCGDLPKVIEGNNIKILKVVYF